MWKLLPSMKKPRSHFNPCLFNRHVYLCGRGSKLVETFSPQTDSFLPFQLLLPEANKGCCLYVHNDLLVVRTAHNIYKFEAEQPGQIIQQTQLLCPEHNFREYSPAQPVVHPARGLICMLEDWNVVIFSMKTGELREISKAFY